MRAGARTGVTDSEPFPVWRRGDSALKLLNDEWLVTNGLGGYASGSIGGICTRRYHGLLVAALPAPLGRIVYLHRLEEAIECDGERIPMTGFESGAGLALPDLDYLEEFALENGVPVWRYRHGGVQLEKRIFMTHLRNTTCVRYSLLQADVPIALMLRPWWQVRPHDERVDTRCPDCELRAVDGHYLVSAPDYPGLFLKVFAGDQAFTPEREFLGDMVYRVERGRGYHYVGRLQSEGCFTIRLAAGAEATLVVSTEPPAQVTALAPEEIWAAEQERRQRLLAAAHPALRAGTANQLVLAADQFVVLPMTRRQEAIRAGYAGEDLRSVIAGYPWFTDWGRDTMISLEGLCLLTGREHEAAAILRTFAHHVRDGLIPNLFPEGDADGLYHTADATLWFFHAMDRYVAITRDVDTLRELLPKMAEIMERHLRGTRFGIRADPGDGLLFQGESGYQLTWMDAKVDDWVVTPRRGKAVEINALFYNALRLLARWLASSDPGQARRFGRHADQVRDAFNRRFWSARLGYLYDVVDGEKGDDPALRPNQLLAISLPHAVLDESRWRPVMEAVSRVLLTPVGLRTLSPDHADYKTQYDGDLRDRDAAYHQGTVWPWLVGPYVDAWIRLHPDRPDEARALLDGFFPHLREACAGTISEIFDAEPPYRARGCMAQAWSVAEVLRCLVKTSE
jgi:predicted glycogen debranching enzyme